jgi:cytochrome c oxidase assembly protein subunit 20
MAEPPKKADDNEWDRIDEERKHLNIFGRDVSEIPCFRDSFLWGIGGGVGTGLGKILKLTKI